MRTSLPIGRIQKSLRERGNLLVLAILVLGLLGAMATAQFVVVHKNSRSSTFFLAHSELRKYAESGLNRSLHDMRYSITTKPGTVGIAGWTTGDDAGRDGMLGTLDEGEGDGMITIGEPNLAPVWVGPALSQTRLAVNVTPTNITDVDRVISTAASPDASATIEALVLRRPFQLPRYGAVYLDPQIDLSLNGNAFTIDGRDHSVTGAYDPSLTPLLGVATAPGNPPGSNQQALLADLPANRGDNITGAGGSPSVGEFPDVNPLLLFQTLAQVRTSVLQPGTYSNQSLGSLPSDIRISYCKGDLQLAGNSQGAGVLLVDGTLQIVGDFTFKGLIIVKGDLHIAGTAQILGSLMVTSEMTVDTFRVGGNSSVFYSSEVLSLVEPSLPSGIRVVYYNER